MGLNTLPTAALSLLPLTISCLILSCQADLQAHWHQHNEVLRAPWLKTNLGSSRQASVERRWHPIMPSVMTRNLAGAFIYPASSSMHNARKNGAILHHVTSTTSMNRSHSATMGFGNSSPFHGSKQPFPRRPFIHSLALSSNDDSGDGQDIIDNDEQQRGMDDAFSSLEELSPEDLVEVNPDDGEDVSDLKYSRTDDTPASDSGKSTKEEAELYLEIQGELEGTTESSSSQEEEADLNADEEDNLDLEIDEMMAQTNEDEDASSNDSEEYPWTSINPILRVRGPVASGYGRGGKKLGVPTANLPASLFQSALEDVTNGVYFGWAVVEQSPSNDASSVTKKGRNTPIKAVVNVGYSPTFEGKENKEKIVEAHLITKSSPMEKADPSMGADDDDDNEDGEVQLNEEGDDVEIEEDFYDETMRLQLIGYLRPEQKFDSFPDLIAQIHRDIGNAHWALDTMPFIFSKEDEFIKDDDGVNWIGSGGGDDVASWEFESW